MLSNQFNLSKNGVTITQVVANLGALSGGTLCGWASQIFGRRFSIVIICIVGGALLYPYTFIKNESVMAAAFFEQFMVQGAWGVIPIHLMELSPGSIRTFVVGTSYQLGNLVSSASSTIESTIGERFPLPPTKAAPHRYEYGKVICIFMGCVFAYVILLTIAGPERLGRNFDADHDADLAVVAAQRGMNRDGYESDPEKATAMQRE
jgi:SHS family lactate transporter-like MFS transporter